MQAGKARYGRPGPALTSAKAAPSAMSLGKTPLFSTSGYACGFPGAGAREIPQKNNEVKARPYELAMTLRAEAEGKGLADMINRASLYLVFERDLGRWAGNSLSANYA
jgi:hypothetical protein